MKSLLIIGGMVLALVSQVRMGQAFVNIWPYPHICYQSHLEGVGWTGTQCDGAVSGTVGEARRMEAITIWSTTPGLHVCYKVHMAGIGWGPKACDGAVAGTTGQSRQIEAMEIWSDNLSYTLSLEYQSQLQNFGWVLSRYDGTMTGTTGQSLRLESIRIYTTDRRACPDAHYYFQTNGKSNGWELVALKTGENALGQPLCRGSVGFQNKSGQTWEDYIDDGVYTRQSTGWTTAHTRSGAIVWLWLDHYNNVQEAWYQPKESINDWLKMDVAAKPFASPVP